MKKFIFRILFLVNLAVAAALLLSYLAAVISPASIVFPAYFGLAYPYLLILNIIMVAIWALFLRSEAFISAVVIVIGINHLSNYIKLSETKEDKTDTFKVMSYNVQLFGMFESENAKSTENAVIQLLKDENADIICLQEVFIRGDVAAKERSIREALGGKYSSHLKTIGRSGSRSFGIMTLSKFPIVNRGEIVHPESSSLTIYTDILINQDTIRVYNNHLQSFRLRKMEKNFIEEIMRDDETINEVKKIWFSLKRGFVKRSLQAQTLKEHINNSKYPVIAAGDFNDTPMSYAYNTIRNGLNDAFANSGYGTGFTYRGNYPTNRIDYILYDKRLTNSNFEILKSEHSDHYPIMAWFKKDD